jgi:RNA polymerase sigma-70 factor (ECF subfamily)
MISYTDLFGGQRAKLVPTQAITDMSEEGAGFAGFATWLYTIAHHRLGDHWRSLKHRPTAPADADERTARVADPDTPERVLSEFERRRQLQLALDDLPEEQREVLLLRLEQELTLEEIADITGVGRETVKSRLRYAMDKLRARLPA